MTGRCNRRVPGKEVSKLVINTLTRFPFVAVSR